MKTSMKTKDVAYILISIALLTATGILAAKTLLPKQTSLPTVATVEVVTPVTTDFDQKTLADLSDRNFAFDYNIPIDLSTGLGNQKPFGPF